MPLSLEQAVARVPQWAGAKELETVLLGGGITHQNIRAAATHAPVSEIHKAMWALRRPAFRSLTFFAAMPACGSVGQLTQFIIPAGETG